MANNQEKFQLALQCAKDSGNLTRTLLIAILLMFGFQLSSTLDSTFDWSGRRAALFTRLYECVAHKEMTRRRVPRPSSLTGHEVSCAELEKKNPFYFEFSENAAREYLNVTPYYLELARAAIATYERSAHQAQIPILGINVEGNNVPIATNILTASLLIALAFSLSSESRLSRQFSKTICRMMTDDTRVYKRAILEVNVFSTPSLRVSMLFWSGLFLPAVVSAVGMYPVHRAWRTQPEHFFNFYLGFDEASKYDFIAVLAWIFLMGASAFAYLRATQLSVDLRRIVQSRRARRLVTKI